MQQQDKLSLSTRVLPSAAALLAGIAYGVAGTTNQIIAGFGFDVGHITVMQFILATLLFGVVALIRRKRMPSKKQIAQLLGIGMVYSIGTLSLFYAIDMLSVGQAVAIQFQYVWMANVLQSILDRKRPNVWVIVSVILLLAGTLFGSGLMDEILASASATGLSLTGVALALVSAVCFALFVCLNGRIAADIDTANRSLFICLAGAFMAMLVIPSFFAQADVIALLPGGLVMSILMNVIPIGSLVFAGKYLPGGVMAIFTSLELPAAVISGCLMLGESVTVFTVFGVALICVGVIISQVPEFKKPALERSHAN